MNEASIPEKLEYRPMASAFLFDGRRVLMMKKEKSRWGALNAWTPVGGHMEPDELARPKAACLREIGEESGLQPDDIEELTLRYILLRIKENEVRQQFVYFGRVRRTDVRSSDEGELFWIDREELSTLNASEVLKQMLAHYFAHPNVSDIYIGTMGTGDAGEPLVRWAPLRDPGVF